MARTSSKSASRSTASRNTSQSTKRSNGKPEVESMLEELFIDQLKDILWAEKALTKALPKMRKAASSEELMQALDDHLAVTQEQITRLEEVFGLMEQTVRAKKCDGMEGLLKEGESVIEETEAGTATRDAGIIISAQKVEHYEIAAYGSLVQLAKTIGRNDVADILVRTLAEEKEADELLTNIAVSGINVTAEQEEEGEEAETETSSKSSRKKR